MRVWLLQSRKGGRTCGHLHVRESGAWRCRDTQPDSAGWSVVSTWLSDPEGARPKQDSAFLALGAGVVLLVLMIVGVLLLAAVWFWTIGEPSGALVSGVLALIFLPLVWSAVQTMVDTYRHPSRGGGWDWL